MFDIPVVHWEEVVAEWKRCLSEVGVLLPDGIMYEEFVVKTLPRHPRYGENYIYDLWPLDSLDGRVDQLNFKGNYLYPFITEGPVVDTVDMLGSLIDRKEELEVFLLFSMLKHEDHLGRSWGQEAKINRLAIRDCLIDQFPWLIDVYHSNAKDLFPKSLLECSDYERLVCPESVTDLLRLTALSLLVLFSRRKLVKLILVEN